jgi:hypothetical protein
VVFKKNGAAGREQPGGGDSHFYTCPRYYFRGGLGLGQT